MDARQRLMEAAERADTQGYTRDDGRYVDPPEVQKEAIEIGFEAAADDPSFDIWSIVNPTVAIREGKTMAENFARVIDQWDQTVEKPALKEKLLELQEKREQNGN